MNNTWIKWTELKPGETMKYQGREFRKDITNDQEKMMMRIINRMNDYDNENKKDQNNKKHAASSLMDMMSGKRGKQAMTRKSWCATNLMMTKIVRQQPNKQTTSLNMT